MSSRHAARIALAWSGGKDSLLALERLREQTSTSVLALVTTFSEQGKRIAMHGIRETLADLQAASLGIPLVKFRIPWPCDNETYQAHFAQALSPLRDEALEGVAFGDLFLPDVRSFREDQMATLGLEPIFPLWGEATWSLAEQFARRGHQAMVVTVDTRQLDPSFLGRAFDAHFLADLPAGVDPMGENGEFHTFTYDGPMFSRPVLFHVGERKVLEEHFCFLDLLPGKPPR